jgi:hypothetical protein
MEIDFSSVRFGSSHKSMMNPISSLKRGEKILLRGPEPCKQCGAYYKSLYIIRLCMDHEELEEL